MKRFRNHSTQRWLGRVLAAAMFLSTAMVGGIRPAQAQRAATYVYLLDFNNRTTVGGGLLGRVAAAQASLQLSQSVNWEVAPEAQVQRQIQLLNLSPPFDRIDRAQIAQGLDAKAVVYGNIVEARVTADPAQAYVRLQVVVEDVSTGTLTNGAIAEGLSTPRIGFMGDADVLLEEALGKAAFRSREFMDRFRLPQGTVLNTSVVGEQNTIALINIGARQGTKTGMRFVVTRLGQYVGRVRVTSVEADNSTCRVTENFQGVRPEDRVRAIFSFEDFPVTGPQVRASNLFSPPTRIATVGAAPTLLAQADQGAGDFQAMVALDDTPGSGANGIPDQVVVEEPATVSRGGGGGGLGGIFNGGALKMLAGGVVLLGILMIGGSASGNSRPPAGGLAAKGFQRGFGAAGARILVTWNRPKSLPANDILGYVVWRTDLFGALLAVWGVDGDGSRRFEDPDNLHDATFWDGDPGDVAGTRATVAGIPGVTAGEQYRYQVATAFNRRGDFDNDGAPDNEQRMSELSSTTTWATAISPARIIDPPANQQVDVTNLPITWEQTPGADVYVIWISSSPTFPKKNTVNAGTFREVPVNLGGAAVVTRVVSIGGGRFRADRLFIAIGARNSNDRLRPHPFGWISSSGVPVRRQDVPPPPPKQAGERNEGAGEAPRPGIGGPGDAGGSVDSGERRPARGQNRRGDPNRNSGPFRGLQLR